jgi:hypothetical protein
MPRSLILSTLVLVAAFVMAAPAVAGPPLEVVAGREARVSPPSSGCTHQTTDRLDDWRGPQVHFIYALPSDLLDRCLDTDGPIEASISNFQTWLLGETDGRRLEVDTFSGLYDITFHRFSETDAEMASHGINLRDHIEDLLKDAGFDDPDKLYSVYYDGTGPHDHCGGGAWPPTLPGFVSALYLRATYGPGNWICYDPYLSEEGLQIMDYAMLHENMHTLGFVATCAPNYFSSHVSDSPTDLMWAGEGNWNPSVLDYGNDDYFNTPSISCLDLADSPYLKEATGGFPGATLWSR